MLDAKRTVVVQLHQKVSMKGVADAFDSEELLARSCFQIEER
jgi:hypothetical protein